MKLSDTYTPKQLELLNKFNKIVGYKIRHLLHFYTIIMKYQKVKKKKPLKITLKY